MLRQTSEVFGEASIAYKLIEICIEIVRLPAVEKPPRSFFKGRKHAEHFCRVALGGDSCSGTREAFLSWKN